MSFQELLALGGPAGLLPVGMGSTLLLLFWVGNRLFPGASLLQRILAGSIVCLGVYQALLQLYLYLGILWAETIVCTNLILLSAWGVERALSRGRAARGGFSFSHWWLTEKNALSRALLVGLRWGSLWSGKWRRVLLGRWAALGLLACVAGGLLLCAVHWLPIWTWDSLGYHLPFVQFVLQGGGFADLPENVPYLSTYPRNVELFFAGIRAFLPDDRWIDGGQLPFGLLAVLATVAIARRWGASRAEACAAGLCWALLPAVYLQLPTNYIDIAQASFFLVAAYFLLLPVEKKTLFCSGIALGLFLGTKSSAPLAAGLLGVLLLFRAVRAKQLWGACGALLLAGCLGLELYIAQWVRHGNPFWPIVVSVGPWELPGTVQVSELLDSGVDVEKVYGSLSSRIFQSWTSLSSTPVFDMRVGGLSLVFWCALPCFFFWWLREKRAEKWLALTLLGFSLATPDPAVVRYIFAFPALVLAGAAVAWSSWRPRGRFFALLLTGLSALNLARSAPALSGPGPSLFSYAALSGEEREVAVGAHGSPRPFVEARRRLQPGEIALYDRAAWLPYLLWRSDAQNRVVRIRNEATLEEALRYLDDPQVQLVVAGHGSVLQAALENREAQFEWQFDCPERCAVYLRAR